MKNVKTVLSHRSDICSSLIEFRRVVTSATSPLAGVMMASPSEQPQPAPPAAPSDQGCQEMEHSGMSSETPQPVETPVSSTQQQGDATPTSSTATKKQETLLYQLLTEEQKQTQGGGAGTAGGGAMAAAAVSQATSTSTTDSTHLPNLSVDEGRLAHIASTCAVL